MHTPNSVFVVGAGLAGLTCSTLLARAGVRVELLERASDVGGRARTAHQHGFCLNQGAHALYDGGPAREVLRELGIHPSGAAPRPQGVVVQHDTERTLPTGLGSLLRSRLLDWRGKLGFATLPRRILGLDPGRFADRSAEQWIRQTFQPALQPMVTALTWIASYCGQLDRLSAAVAIRQLQLALGGGVRYLDGGWQRLVEPLRETARAAGVTLHTGTRVQQVEPSASGIALRTHDGMRREADRAILAVAPGAAAGLVPTSDALQRWRDQLQPMYATTVDLGLDQLPCPETNFAIDLDRRLYLSVHSQVACLAPPGGAVVHLIRYSCEGEDPPDGVAELEAFMDRLQPGWRAHVRARRTLPRMPVTQALVTPEMTAGGTGAGRPGPQVPDCPGVLVCGDWVGPDGFLADGAFASASMAARQILTDTPGARAA